MRIFKTRAFARWARDERLTDQALLHAVQEMDQGLVDASLGGGLFKKRIAIRGGEANAEACVRWWRLEKASE